ncbi:MAG: radical SAM family heme chaperone HemW [Bacilli bacterium]|nr:radical SAM family heme chaperone HemW [Bacilli bacterium]
MPFQVAKSLYVHIPFCDGICPYCDFCKVEKSTHYEQGYLKALLFDIQNLGSRRFDTVYVGGGTPTCLEDDNFLRLLKALSPLLEIGGEFTVEANPESLSEAKIAMMKENGVNRVSIGVESTSRKNLLFLGRKHSFDLVKDRVYALKKAGIDNINLDLMYGLPGEGLDEVKEDIDNLLSLSPTHISTYSLILEKGTDFYARGIKEGEQEEVADQYELINDLLKKSGYHRYEVSNFSLPDKESRHNLVYWENRPYVGLGAGASGYEDGVRYRNTFSIPRFNEGKRKVEEEKVDRDSEASYFLLTGLRLAKGISLKEYRSLFGMDLLSNRKEAIDRHIGLGNIEIKGDRLMVKEERMILLDRVLVDLI